MAEPYTTLGKAVTESGGKRLAGDVFFAPFRLDPTSGRLWSGATEVAIRPKTFAVLRHLVENPGGVTTVADLVHAVWAGSHGSAPLVKGCIRELRMLLDDDHESPRYIETVGRRGYRFMAPIDAVPTPAAPAEGRAVPFVGRRTELERLDRLFAAAVGGKRQIVFMSGEAGIGKTTLAERFLNAALRRTELLLGRGHCVERSGTGEPYLPVLEALGRMCRGQGGERVLGVLGRYAPTWLAELSPLLSEAEREALRGRTQGATRERMLREMCEAAEALAAERPLVLWLDDLQWSDSSTIDLVTHLASRAEPARLFVLGTYRPSEVVVGGHPLRAASQDLLARGLCHDLALGFFSPSDVEDYLALHFPANDLPSSFGATLLAITAGNPLFLSALLEDLVTRGILAGEEEGWRLRGAIEASGSALPDTLRHLIERQFERLASADQRILEAGSVAGREFAAGAVSTALAIDADEADARLEALVAQTQLVEARGIDSSPGRAPSGRYAFVHALHQRALYDRLPPSRRARLHRRLGEAEERAWGDRRGEIAAELALHFERGGDLAAAIRHLRAAAGNAARKHAGPEAIALLGRALDLVERLPRRDRATEELRAEILRERGIVHRAAGDMLGATSDFDAAVAVARREGLLHAEVGGLLELASALMWYDRSRWQSVLGEVRALTDRLDDPWLVTHALGVCAEGSLELAGWHAEDFAASARAVAAARERGERALLALHLANYAYFHLDRSEYAEAYCIAGEGHEIALEAGEAYTDFTCLGIQNMALLGAGEWGRMRREAREAVARAERDGQQFAAGMLRLNEGSLSLEAFDFAAARAIAESVIEGFRAAFFLYGELFARILLGRADIGLGRTDEGLACLTEAAELARVMMLDWFFHLPLQHGLADGWLAKGDLVRARTHAAELVERAERGPERSFVAIGHDLNARIALAAGKRTLAKREVDRALEVVEAGKLPVAEWRVFETAARTAERGGEALRFWRRSAAVLRTLADSLGEGSERGRTLLGAPRVEEIFRRAGRSRLARTRAG